MKSSIALTHKHARTWHSSFSNSWCKARGMIPDNGSCLCEILKHKHMGDKFFTHFFPREGAFRAPFSFHSKRFSCSSLSIAGIRSSTNISHSLYFSTHANTVQLYPVRTSSISGAAIALYTCICFDSGPNTLSKVNVLEPSFSKATRISPFFD